MIVGLAGDIDLSATVAVRAAFHEVTSDGWNRVLVDLTDVTFIDSAALGLLIGLQRRCRAADGSLVLVNPQPVVERILATTGLDTLLPSAADIETGCAIAMNATTDVAS